MIVFIFSVIIVFVACNLNKYDNDILDNLNFDEEDDCSATNFRILFVKNTTEIETILKPYISNSKRNPGEISKEKCMKYLMCNVFDNLIGKDSILSGFNSPFINFIYGGYNALESEFPHMALIGYENNNCITWRCGGSLISEKFVLTAAHCLRSTNLGSPKVVKVGMINTKNTEHSQQSNISKIIFYPHHQKGLLYHDIGLIGLSEPFQLNSNVKPACLHLESDLQLFKPVVTGWGDTYVDSGKGSEKLLKTELEFYDHATCNAIYTKFISKSYSKIKHGILPEVMICAGSTTDIKDTCRGDSGGPLQIHDGNVYFVIGVTSFGKPCGISKNSPGIYTRVQSYLAWIEDVVWPE